MHKSAFLPSSSLHLKTLIVPYYMLWACDRKLCFDPKKSLKSGTGRTINISPTRQRIRRGRQSVSFSLTRFRQQSSHWALDDLDFPCFECEMRENDCSNGCKDCYNDDWRRVRFSGWSESLGYRVYGDVTWCRDTVTLWSKFQILKRRVPIVSAIWLCSIL